MSDSVDQNLFDPRECDTVGELQEYLEQLPDDVPLKVFANGVYLDGATAEIDNANLVIQ